MLRDAPLERILRLNFQFSVNEKAAPAECRVGLGASGQGRARLLPRGIYIVLAPQTERKSEAKHSRGGAIAGARRCETDDILEKDHAPGRDHEG